MSLTSRGKVRKLVWNMVFIGLKYGHGNCIPPPLPHPHPHPHSLPSPTPLSRLPFTRRMDYKRDFRSKTMKHVVIKEIWRHDGSKFDIKNLKKTTKHAVTNPEWSPSCCAGDKMAESWSPRPFYVWVKIPSTLCRIISPYWHYHARKWPRIKQKNMGRWKTCILRHYFKSCFRPKWEKLFPSLALKSQFYRKSET